LEFTGDADFGSGTEGFTIVIDPTVDPGPYSVTIYPQFSSPCILMASIVCTLGVWEGTAHGNCGGGSDYVVTFHGTF
jgi:hypothetical protein